MPDFRGTKFTASSSVCCKPCGVLSITTKACWPVRVCVGAPSDASKEDDGKLHSLEGTVKIEDLIPVTAASNIKIYVKAVSAQGYTFTYDLFDGTVNQDITDFETTADISGGDYTVTDPAGSKYEP